jgi:hypothetical protein
MKRIEVLALINAKLSEFTTGLNYWTEELGKTDNTEVRQAECRTNVAYFQAAYAEFFSFYIQIKHP